MPLYDYGCAVCGNSKEVQHPMSEIGKIEVMCQCGSKMDKMLSAPSLIGFDNAARSISKSEKSAVKSEAPSCAGGACACAGAN